MTPQFPLRRFLIKSIFSYINIVGFTQNLIVIIQLKIYISSVFLLNRILNDTMLRIRQIPFIIFFTLLAAAQPSAARERVAGAFLPGETLDLAERVQVRNNEQVRFTDRDVADMDLDGIPDTVYAAEGLFIAWGAEGKGLSVLSGSKGRFALHDSNGDGAPDVFQEEGLGQLVLYRNVSMPALQWEPLRFPEDSLGYFPYAFSAGEVSGMRFYPSVNVSQISLTADSSGLRVVPFPDWNGKAVLTLAYGNDRLMDTLEIPVEVMPVNDPPERIGELPLRRMREDTELLLHRDSLLAVYRDPDRDDSLRIRLPGTQNRLTEQDDLYIYRPPENWYGEDSAAFLISDGEYGDTLYQEIIVSPVNDAPQWESLRDLEMREDELFRRPVSYLYEYVNDVETPDTLLRLQAFSGKNVAISLEGGTVTVLPEKNWYGSDTLMLTAGDGELRDTVYWKVHVAPVNDPPVLHPLPEVVFFEDDTLFIGLSTLQGFAEDVETPRKELKWQVRRLGRIRTFYNGYRIRITAPENWYGVDSIRLTVSDGELTASRNWVIRVRPVNDPPRWRHMALRSVPEDDTLRITFRELYRHISDPETPDEDLRREVLPMDDLSVKETRSTLEFYAKPDWYGDTRIRIRFSDGELADTGTVRVRVISVNDPPQLSPIPDLVWAEDDTLTLSRGYLRSFASDVETPTGELQWHFATDPPVFVREEKERIRLSAAPDWNGRSRIAFVIDDGGLRDTSLTEIRVTPVNDAPRWKALPDTHIVEDRSLTLPLAFIHRFVSDPDAGDSIAIDVKAGKNIYMEEKGDTLILWPEPDWYGQESLELTASDGKKTVKKTWKMPVKAVNDPPYFTMSLPDSLSFQANSSDTLIFEDIVYDIDNDISDLVWEITPGRIVRYFIDDDMGGAVFYTEKYRSGEDAITIRVTDGHDMIVYYMPVFVHEVDRFLSANPDKLELFPNSPNPFTDFTDIRYSLPASGYVTIRIYDLLGKQIKELANGHHEARNYSVRWYGETESGMPAPSGVYLCRMTAMVNSERVVMMRKMMLVR